MLLLLHGAMGCAGDFESIINELPSEKRCKAMNFPGHGGQDSKDFGLEGFMNAILDFMSKHHVEQVDLFGYSMGGYVAIHFATLYPNRVNKIMTLNTIWDWNETVTQKMIGALDTEKIKAKAPAYADFLGLMHAPNGWEELAINTQNLLKQLALGQGIEFAKLKEIKAPVFIARGEFDPIVSAEESRWITELIANGKYCEVKGGKHLLDQVDSSELSDLILEFFGSGAPNPKQ